MVTVETKTMNVKNIANAIVNALSDAGHEPVVDYHYDGRPVRRAAADGRGRPRRTAKKIAQRGGCAHFIHGADAISIRAGGQTLTVGPRGFRSYSGYLFSGGRPWPQAAYAAAG
jgi:hypothetical protein